jgi:hypothetical protein
MDYRQMTAPCGLDCWNCPVYMAGSDDGLRSKVAERLGVPVEKAVCRGCRHEEGRIEAIGRTQPCYVYKCIKDKGLEFCHECGDFPCDYLHPYADQAGQRPHNTKVFNLCLIKRMGLEGWAKEKAAQVKANYFQGKLKLGD